MVRIKFLLHVMKSATVVILGTGLCTAQPSLAAVDASSAIKASLHKGSIVAPKALRFKLLNKFSGGRASGRIVLKVALFDQSDGADINLIFDDDNWGTTNYYGDQPGTTIGTFPLDTDEEKNGFHSIKVLDSSGNSDTDTVYIWNPISDFSCSNGFRTLRCTISASLNVPQWWRVSLVGISGGNPIREYYGYGSTIDIVFDGHGLTGYTALRGAYMVDLRAIKSHAQAAECINF